ncbi:hypothetical protein EV178_006605, partial [Coemansia sp. RSA 1646]
GTPQTYIEKVDKFDKEWYVKVSNEYDDICTETDLRDALDMLGDGWSSSWDQFSKIPATTIEDILTTYRSKCTAFQAGLAAPKVSESSYQSAFGALAEAVQEHVSAQPGLPALHWFDTHSANIRRADGTCRKPDGCFSVHPARHQWKDIAVVVEIKDHMVDGKDHHPRGQILQDFIDMAENQPRRFMLGLALGKGHAIHLYACVPGGIYIAKLGNLHLAGVGKLRSAGPDDPNEHEQRVVAFLLFLYKRLGEDYGYLTTRRIDVPGSFILGDIVGASTDDSYTITSKSAVVLKSAKRVLGRHGYLKGQRTWAYPAKVTNGGKSIHAYFKFQWAFDGDLELDVHQFVLDRRVPHVPELLYTT